MPNCCSNCFNDSKITEIVRSEIENARCAFCNTDNANCFDPALLSESLEVTIDLLIEDDTGEYIDEIYEREFPILTSEVNDPRRLWSAILGADAVNKKYRLKYDTNQYERDWAGFKYDLIHNNRFFPNNNIFKDMFSSSEGNPEGTTFRQVIEELKTSRETHERFFRARISEQALTKADMWQPPANIVTAGRANPIGIAYLYIADNIATSIHEVRPSNGSIVYVSEFTPNEELTLIDLRNPKATASLINLTLNMSDIEMVLKHLKLLELFAKDLAKTVVPERSHLEYIPTQFLCEFFKSIEIKSTGHPEPEYDGIIFSSSFGNGDNIVLFDVSKMTNEEPLAHTVTETRLSFNELA